MGKRVKIDGSIAVLTDGSRGGEASIEFDDSTGQTQDWARVVYFLLATMGLPGAVFQTIECPPSRVEKLLIHSRNAQDFVLRINGAVAQMTGAGANFASIVNNDAFTLEVDGVTQTVTFLTGDTTIGAVCDRINSAFDAIVATSASGQLKLSGTKTGGQEALARNFSYGRVTVSGAALSKLGLTASAVYGSGADVRSKGRLLIEPSTTELVTKLEISGQADIGMCISGT